MSFLSIGTVLSTWGNRGALRLAPAARDVSRFKRLREVWIGQRAFTVQNARPHKGAVVLELEQIQNMNEAETLVGSDVLVKEQDAIRPEEGEYFIHDLVGLAVYTDRDRLVGKLTRVIQGSAQDIYEVQGPFGEVLVPATQSIVLKVDLEARRMQIFDLPGLIEPDPPL